MGIIISYFLNKKNKRLAKIKNYADLKEEEDCLIFYNDNYIGGKILFRDEEKYSIINNNHH